MDPCRPEIRRWCLGVLAIAACTDPARHSASAGLPHDTAPPTDDTDAVSSDPPAGGDTDPIAIRPLPEGIVYLPTDGGPEDLAALFALEVVDGVKLRIPWSAVQTSASTYDWSTVDAWLDEAEAADKFVSLSVMGGQSTPTWFYEAHPDADAVVIRQTGPRQVRMPTPWDPDHLSEWTAFIAALGARYATHPHLGYVTATGFGKAAETVLPPRHDGVQVYDADDLPDWEAATQAILTAYLDAFEPVPVTIALHNALLPGTDLDPEPSFDRVFTAVSPGWSRSLGIENHGLHADASASLGREDANLHQRLGAATQAGRLGVYQLVCSTTHDTVCDPAWVRGSLSEALDAGAKLGGRVFEVYANDVEDPEHATVLRRY